MKTQINTIDAIKFQELLDACVVDKDVEIAGKPYEAMFNACNKDGIELEDKITELQAHINHQREALLSAIEALPELIVNTETEFEQQAKNYEGYPNLAYKYNYLKDEADRGTEAYKLCKNTLSATPAQSLTKHDEAVRASEREAIAEYVGRNLMSCGEYEEAIRARGGK